ncbi:uncharacterized protein LOC100162409 isoform X1 [Acyrthosiphon pisum]|uniref:Transmembrane protein n=2 Tax=Acyrthosiphon pisum TaxID=7029 RepID=A0A8R2A722_ACYPI|nr:uncharacterized protein LOC100162409 isoform X1 [Acyrthosiphon pisum]|eukprot:XP_001949724.1 PREDICTED: uncharacterized protein LOC100162409 isoform X1 [Acyrthosiphon pisum]
MDGKELRFYDDHQNDGNGLSDQGTSTDNVLGKTAMNDECYVNKGFNDSNSLKEESSNKIEVDPNQLSKSVIIISDGPPLTMQDGYINNAFEDGPQKADKVNDKDNGTVPRAHDVTAITSSIIENQITKLDEDNNELVAVNLETKEKKWKVQSVGWDSNKSIILLGLVLAFDVWAAIFVCFKTNLFPNILN